MKKNILISILTAIILVSLIACNNSEGESNTDDAVNETEPSTATPDSSEKESGESVNDVNCPPDLADPEDEYYYTVELDNGADILLGEAADDTLSALGEASSVTEAPSCVYDGMDRLYNYGAFTVTTSPDANGYERISELSFNSDAVALKNGISIGASKSLVESVFGTDYTESFGVLKFELDGAVLSIVLDEDDTVIALTFSAK